MGLKTWMVISFILILCHFMTKTTQARRALVVKHQEYTHLLENEQSRPWRPPNYTNQKSALGYTSDTFNVPEKLKEHWQFWVDIYSKYSTHQGLLHDSLYPYLIYEVIDFAKIDENPHLTDAQKISKREEFVKQRKKKVKALILSLQGIKNPSRKRLSSEQKRLWRLFERIKGSKKYKEAATDRRLRFQLGQKDRFLQGIFYSGRYLEVMEDIFKKANLPLELTRLPFVESSFNILARSKVGASGIWQFMPRTGREYMVVNALIDERNDPIRATEASAKMLKHNYRRLKDWPLAITAYNFGLYGIRRLVKRRGTSDLVEIIDSKKRSHRFGFASANFYLSFLAAVFVEQHALKYFFQEKEGNIALWAENLDYETVRIKSSIPVSYLISFFNNDKNLAFLYNPHLNKNIQRGYFDIPKKTNLYLKPGYMQAFVKNMPQTNKDIIYKVLKGDTLFKLAKKFDVSLPILMRVNKISHPRRLKIGQTLVIPNATKAQVVYKVVRGDTLLKIAGKFDVSSHNLIRTNKISNPNYLRAGQTLLIPDNSNK